jgi:hypothetical protein
MLSMKLPILLLLSLFFSPSPGATEGLRKHRSKEAILKSNARTSNAT